jgi:hypothetical protein
MAVCGLLLAVAALAPVRAQSAGDVEAKPIAVLAISSYEELMQDADFLGGLLGMPQISQSVDAMLQGAQGLDKTKPMGLLVTQYGLPPTFAACLPVTDMNAFLEALKPFNVTSQASGEYTEISVFGQTLYAKNANGWTLVSIAPIMLETMPADPAAEFAKLTSEYDVAMQFNLQNVPAEVRQQWTDLIAMSAKAGVTKQDDESDEDFAKRQAQLDAQLEKQKQMINELDQVTIGTGVDRTGQRALMDFVYTSVAGSNFAKQLGAYKDTATNYAGFAQEGAAMTLAFAAKTTDMTPEELDEVADSLKAQAETAIAQESELKNEDSKELLKGVVGDFVEALRGTLHAGGIDGGAVLNLSPDALTLVAGGTVADPSKVADGLKKLQEVAKSEQLDMPEIQWDAQSHGDVKFHTMSAPVKNSDDDAKALFGENVDMAIGLGEKSLYFAMGKNWLDAVKKVIDDSAANQGKSIKPMEMTVTATPIVQTAAAHADEDDKPIFEMVNGSLQQAQGRDHARIVAEPIENGVRTRFEVEDGVLRAIGTAVMAKQMQAAQAN